MKLNGAQIFLKMLQLYEVKHVFGLPGETTLTLYKYWSDCPEIKHVLTHDERNAAYMAEAYAKVTGSVGISEAPSPGGAHPAPGILESFTGSVPTICFTSDVPFNCDKRNMLSGFDQNRLYDAITKESILVTRARDLPFLIRRAFRVALSGRPGAVHVRIPMDTYTEEVEVDDLYADWAGNHWPSSRPIADFEQIERAIDFLAAAQHPVIVCGQGALVSEASKAITALAEVFQIPVGCTMTGKGTVSEIHPLSLRLIGARGGTSFANEFIENSDLVFFIGSNTDSAGTDSWRLPNQKRPPRVIQLDISGIEVGNNYQASVVLVGDAKATVEFMLERVKQRRVKVSAKNTCKVVSAMKALDDSLTNASVSSQVPVHPVRFIKTLQDYLPHDSYVVLEPSVACIFSAAYMVQKEYGRRFISNYSNGALGYMIPACVAVAIAHPEATVIGLGGDGSFHFSCGELETHARLGINAKMVVFRNDAFGWIKGETAHVYHSDFFAADFGNVDYAGVAEAFGIKSYRIHEPSIINQTLKEAIEYNGPVLIEVWVPDEAQLVPPVPRWIPNAKEKAIPYFY